MRLFAEKQRRERPELGDVFYVRVTVGVSLAMAAFKELPEVPKPIPFGKLGLGSLGRNAMDFRYVSGELRPLR